MNRVRAVEAVLPVSEVAQRDSHGPQLVTQKQICDRLGVSDETWRRWRQRGITPQRVDLPGRPRWRAADIDRFLNRDRLSRRG